MTFSIQDPQLSNKISPKTAATALGPVEYADIGQGPVVVALHGAMGGYDQSLILAQTIGNGDYRYLAVSRPGYLGTPLASGKTSEQQGDLIAALLDQLNINTAGIMAVSGGGPSALQFALRHPARCAGLVLVSTCAGKMPTSIPFPFKIMMLLARWPWYAKRLYQKTARNLDATARSRIDDPEILARMLNDADTWELFSISLLSAFDRLGQRLAGTQNDIAITSREDYPLEQVDAPVLIIHGTQDPRVPFEKHAQVLAARLPHAELLAVDGGKHGAIFTHRDQVRPKVHDFMQSHFGGASH
jgi:pimeloyl-ACP methyl ester carboxylesterase